MSARLDPQYSETIPSQQVQPRHANSSWYALRVRSKFENVVSAALRGKGYEEFLPVCRSRRHWCDRVREIATPLFRGYLFCRFDVHDRLLPILTTRGVIAVVGFGKTPVAVGDDEIEAIRAILRSGLAVQPWPLLGVGSRVYIDGGPLEGLEGTVTNTDKVFRLVVSVGILQRSVAVEIDRDWVRPIPHGVASRPHFAVSDAGSGARRSGTTGRRIAADKAGRVED